MIMSGRYNRISSTISLAVRIHHLFQHCFNSVSEVILCAYRVHEELKQNTATCYDFDGFCCCLDKSNIILAPFCGAIPCEEKIKALSARYGGLFLPSLCTKKFSLII